MIRTSNNNDYNVADGNDVGDIFNKTQWKRFKEDVPRRSLFVFNRSWLSEWL